MKTLFYVDIDSTLNARNAYREWGLETFKTSKATTEGRTYEISWSQDMIDTLFALDFELVWATTWEEDAGKAIAPLIGHGHNARWLSHYENEPRFPSIHWKMDKLLVDQEANPSPFVWLDDELRPEHIKKAEELGGLAIRINGAIGISRKNIADIVDYINKHA
jgi:hypothetical protein